MQNKRRGTLGQWRKHGCPINRQTVSVNQENKLKDLLCKIVTVVGSTVWCTQEFVKWVDLTVSVLTTIKLN